MFQKIKKGVVGLVIISLTIGNLFLPATADALVAEKVITTTFVTLVTDAEIAVEAAEIEIKGIEALPKITVLIGAASVAGAEALLIASEELVRAAKVALKTIQDTVTTTGDAIAAADIAAFATLATEISAAAALLGVPTVEINPITLKGDYDTILRALIENVNDYEERIEIMEAKLRDLRGRTENLKQDFLKILISILKRQLLNYMQNQIIDWIQGGGTPRFVTDWEGFMLDAANRAAGDFAQEIGLGFMCDPFALQVQLALFPVKKFPEVAGCTLDDIVGNINNFIDDFRSGGWIAYNTAWQPQNNFFGLVLLGWNERSKRVAAALEQDVNEAIAGSGFLNQKKCEKDANGKDIPGTCKTVTPGTVVGETVKQAIGADFDFIVNADDISDFVEAIVNALLNRLITEGVGALKKGLSDDGGSTKFIRQFR